jgi:TonB family protein
MANKLTMVVLACVLLCSLVGAQYVPGPSGATPPVRPTRSEAELRAEIAAQAASVRAYLELAALYRISNRPHDAVSTLRTALAATRQPDRVYPMLLSLYPAMYYPEEVASIAEEWRRASPSNVQPILFTAAAHVEWARRLRMTQPHDAETHIAQAVQAIDDALALRPDDPSIDMPHATVLRAKADFVVDPSERARLMRESADLMEKARARMPQLQPRLAGGITGDVPEAPPPPPPPPGAPVRVGGNIQQPTKTKDVRPVYPPEAQEARVQGVVIVELQVGPDGKVTNARVLRSIPLLDKAALDAVQQWEFTPTLLNGVAVPVILTATVDFALR